MLSIEELIMNFVHNIDVQERERESKNRGLLPYRSRNQKTTFTRRKHIARRTEKQNKSI